MMLDGRKNDSLYHIFSVFLCINFLVYQSISTKLLLLLLLRLLLLILLPQFVVFAADVSWRHVPYWRQRISFACWISSTTPYDRLRTLKHSEDLFSWTSTTISWKPLMEYQLYDLCVYSCWARTGQNCAINSCSRSDGLGLGLVMIAVVVVVKVHTEQRNWIELKWHGLVFFRNWPIGKQ